MSITLRIALLLCLSFFVSAVFAQDELRFSDRYNVEVGKPYPVVDGAKYYFRGNNSVLCVKIRGKSWMIQTLSSETLTQKSRKEYTDMPEDMSIESIDRFGDRAFVFFSLWDKQSEREQLFQREIDMETGTFTGKPVKILTINGKVTGSLMSTGFYRFKVTDKFDMLYSENEKFMLVQYRKKRDRKDKEGPNELGMALFGADMTQVWSGDVRLPYDGENMGIMDYTLDNNGSIAMVVRVYGGNAEKTKDREQSDYRYELVRGGTNGDQWDIEPIELPSKYLLSMMLFQESDGTLRGGGFYNGLNNKSLTADGIYTCAFDGQNKLINARFHEIPTALLNMYVGKREIKKNAKEEDKGEEVGFRNMQLVKTISDVDGSLLLVGEKRYITQKCVTDSRGNTRCYDVYHADDLLISSLTPSGDLAWMKRIPKRIQSMTPIGKSFSYMNSEGEHHFMHFDTDRNVQLSVDDTPDLKGRLIVMVDRINENTGAVEREAVLNTEEIKGIKLYQLAQDRMVRTSNSELLMEAYKKDKEDILVRIQAKE